MMRKGQREDPFLSQALFVDTDLHTCSAVSPKDRSPHRNRGGIHGQSPNGGPMSPGRRSLGSPKSGTMSPGRRSVGGSPTQRVSKEWNASTSVMDQVIPDYDAEKDKFCTYTETASFRASPYYQLKLNRKEEEEKVLASTTLLPHQPSRRVLDYFDKGEEALNHVLDYQHLAKAKTKKRPLSLIGSPSNDQGARRGSRVALRELHAMKLVFLREGLLEDLEKKFRKVKNKLKAGSVHENWDDVAMEAYIHTLANSLIANMDLLRLRTVQVIEAIDAWRTELQENNTSTDIKQFLWKDSNYLLKITADTLFLCEPILNRRGESVLRLLGLASARNPFLLSANLDELAKMSDAQDEVDDDDTISVFNVGNVLCSSNDEEIPSISEKRIYSAARTLIQEEEVFGRIAPFEYNTLPKDPSQNVLPSLRRQHSQDDMYCGLATEEKLARGRSGGSGLRSNKDKSSNYAGVLSMADRRQLLGSGSSRRMDVATPGFWKRKDSQRDVMVTDTGIISVRIDHIVQLRMHPSELTQGILGAVRVLLLDPREPIPPKSEFKWLRLADHLLREPMKLMQGLANFKASRYVTVSKAKFLQPIFRDERFDPDRIRPHSEGAALLCSWCMVQASKYVFSPELCCDYNEHLKLEQHQVVNEIANLRHELQSLKTQISNGMIMKVGNSSSNEEENPQFAVPTSTTTNNLLIAENDEISVEHDWKHAGDIVVRKKGESKDHFFCSSLIEKECGLNIHTVSRCGSRQEKNKVLSTLQMMAKSAKKSRSFLGISSLFLEEKPAFVKVRLDTTGKSSISLDISNGYEPSTTVSVSQDLLDTVLSLTPELRSLKRGFYDLKQADALVRFLCKLVVPGEDGEYVIDPKLMLVKFEHPEHGFDISGVLAYVKVIILENYDIQFDLYELFGTQTAGEVEAELENLSPKFTYRLSLNQYRLLGFPTAIEAIERLQIKPYIGLSINCIVFEREDLYLSGHLVSRLVAEANVEGLVVRCFGHNGKLLAEKLMKTEQVMKLVSALQFGEHEDNLSITPTLKYEALPDLLLLLSWPVAETKYRLELIDWKEEGLKLNVRLEDPASPASGTKDLGSIILGPRSTLYDARIQIKRLLKRNCTDMIGPSLFKFGPCPNRKEEVEFHAFDYYPDLRIFYVEEYSDDEDDDDDEILSDDENIFDMEIHSPDSSKKTSKLKKKKQPKKKRRKLKRKTKRGTTSFLDRLINRGKNANGKEEELDGKTKEEQEEEERKALEEKKRKEQEERERREREQVYLEELVKLSGTVTVSRGSSEISTSVDLLESVQRGDMLEIEGIRCFISKDKTTRFDPATIPLAKPFDLPEKEIPKQDEQDLGDIKEEEEGNEEIKQKDQEDDDKVIVEEGEEWIFEPKEYVNVVAYQVQRTPVKVVEIEGALVSTKQDSNSIQVNMDLRGTLKPGDFIRIDNWNIIQLSIDTADPFTETELTLEKPYDAGTSILVNLEKVLPMDNGNKRISAMERQLAQHEERLKKQRREEELKQTETFFGLTLTWKSLVPLLGQTPYNMRQQDFWEKVTFTFAMDGLYRMVTQQWYPPSEGLDNQKFIKLLREIPGMITKKVTTTELDLVFSKAKDGGKRILTKKEFMNVALPLIGKLHYSWIEDSDLAKEKLLNELVYPWEGCQRVMWNEAKRLAIKEEARRQCAATRIQATGRGHLGQLLLKLHLNAARKIQKQIKSYLARGEFITRLEQEKQRKQVRKAELESLRKARKKARLYGRARLIGGVVNLVTVSRHTKGSIVIVCYNPINCAQFKFTVPLPELRRIVEESSTAANLTDSDFYRTKYLEYVLQRLQYRKRVGEKAIVLGKKPNTEKGNKLLVQGVYVSCTDKSKVLYIVTVTLARNEYSFNCYNPENGKIKVVELSRQSLCKWFEFDEEKDKQNVPELLKPENQAQLVQWMLKRLMLCKACALNAHYTSHKRGEDVLMLECELSEQRDHNMAARLQGMWRKRQSRRTMCSLISRAYRKQWDPNSNRWYYVRFDTGEVSWDKPKLLGNLDLEDPPDVWEEAWDANGNRYYYHPSTGRTSWMSETEAATTVQRLYRKRQAREFQMEFSDMVKAMTFQRQSEINYEKNPERLACITNYALLVHTRDFQYIKAKQLYTKALEMAPSSPLLLYAMGMFELANNTYPRKDTFEKAMKRVDQARRLDPQHLKFDGAFKAFFFWAVLAQPQSSKAWLHYALCQQCVFQDYEAAEKFYRRALDLDPNNESALDNYEDFQEHRLPGGRFSGGGPGERVRKRSVVVQQDGEWSQMRDPEAKHEGFALFWVNEVNHQTQWKTPNWELEWIQRRKRAQIINEKDGWSQYLDPVTNQYFYYSLQQGVASWEAPDYLRGAFQY